jgi:Tfp pilus assembly protein PilV
MKLLLSSWLTVAEWVAGDHSQPATWSYGVHNNVAYHKSWRTTQVQFQETNQQADWGNWYWSTANVASLSYQSGTDSVVRSNFASNGTLPNTQDTNYRAINNAWPVFGFANNIGTVASTLVSTRYTLGLCQQEAINFNGTSSVVPLPSLWTNYFANDLDAVRSVSACTRINMI